jgi:tetratricopeptide (TPR) repeat protein
MSGIVSLFFIVISFGLLWWGRIRDKKLYFFGLWFLLLYVPVSNLIPLVNPMAYRFVYLPGLGLCVISAVLIDQLWTLLRHKGKSHLGNTLSIMILSFLMMLSFGLNTFYKNNFSLFWIWVEKFPQNGWGYYFLGKEYSDIREYDKALEILEKGLQSNAQFIQSKDYLELMLTIKKQHINKG